MAFVAKVVRPGSEVHADEASHWDVLHAHFETKRINHSLAYSLDGACTNQAESFLARLGGWLMASIMGQPQYLYQYANHAAGLKIIGGWTTARWPSRAGTGATSSQSVLERLLAACCTRLVFADWIDLMRRIPPQH